MRVVRVVRVAVDVREGPADQHLRLAAALVVGLLEVVIVAEWQDLEATDVGEAVVAGAVQGDAVAEVDAQDVDIGARGLAQARRDCL